MHSSVDVDFQSTIKIVQPSNHTALVKSSEQVIGSRSLAIDA